MVRHLTTISVLFSLILFGCAAAPEREEALSSQGYEAMKAGDMQRAESLLMEALDQNPDDLRALTYLGALYQNTGRSELARPLYQRVIDGEASYQEAAATEEESLEVERLVGLARTNLDEIEREEAEKQAALAPQPEVAPEPELPAETETPAPEPVAVPAGEFRIQIGAFRSRGNAERMSDRFRDSHPEVVGEKGLFLVHVDGLTKVQVGPYATLSEANHVCRDFKRAGVSCFARRR